MKGVIPLVGAAILLAVVGMLFLRPGAIGLEEAVWCNIFEYQTCYLHKDFARTANLVYPALFTAEKTFTCGNDECRLLTKLPSGAALAVNNIGITLPYTMRYGDNLKLTSAVSGNDANINYDAYNRRLDWCGSSPCSNGIAVIGSDKCTFVTDKSIYSSVGQLLRNPTSSGQSYTVPTDSSIQLANGQQFICGTKFNQCSADTDCVAGHTFTYNGLGAEASGGSLQVYGCVIGAITPTQEQRDVTQQEKSGIISTSFNYGNRCQVKSTQTVQCIPGAASCGSNSVCDVSTFTCKQTGTVKCTQDRDCGLGVVYDQPTKSYYNYVCKNPNTLLSFCDRNLLKTVQCAYNNECPVNSYCDADNTCKQTTGPKASCPTTCCINDIRYFDKPPPVGNVCCPGGTDYAGSLQQCSNKPPGGGGINDIIARFIASFIIAAIILGVIFVSSMFIPFLRPISIIIANPGIFLLTTLILGLAIFFMAGGLAASLVGIS